MLDKLIPWRKKQKQNTDVVPFTDRVQDPFGMDSFLPGFPFFGENRLTPRVDIKEGGRYITVKAEIPGVEKEDIDISVNGSLLRIKGEKKQEKEEKGENYYRLESGYGFFCRSIELPAPVDPETVDAKYRRGVLTVKIKKAEESHSRKIPITSG